MRKYLVIIPAFFAVPRIAVADNYDCRIKI
jgi:hypothetical protein